MKNFTAYYLLALSAIASALTVPGVSHGQLAERDGQSVNLIFLAGPAPYNLTIPADGQEHLTNSDLNINLILSDNYDPYTYCQFKTADAVALAPSLVQRPEDYAPINEIAVGPPSPIISVTCNGICLSIYADCYDTQGQFVAPCCNGYCAADKCRPYKIINY